VKTTVKKVFVVEVHTAKLQPIYNLLKQSLKYETMTLANWTYTKDEWKAFIRSSARKNNMFNRMVHFFMSKSVQSAPVVRITPERVWIGNNEQHFSSGKNQLKQISICESDSVNIMQIIYERHNSRGISSNEIRIPVPRGRLKEAIEVEEKLNAVKKTIQQG
jgi:hypothetical protein